MNIHIIIGLIAGATVALAYIHDRKQK